MDHNALIPLATVLALRTLHLYYLNGIYYDFTVYWDNKVYSWKAVLLTFRT